MKNGLIVVNVILAVAVGYLLMVQWRSKKPAAAGGKLSSKDSSATPNSFRIAYFEMDSIEANFNMVKDVKSEISMKDEEYNRSLSVLDQTYRNKYNEYMQKGLSQTESEAAQMDLKKLGDQLKDQKQVLDQKYQDFVMRRNLDIKKKIEEFLAGYNQAKMYSYIVSYEQGLFYYKDTVYNITADVIKGLNEMYKPKK
jgi:outer membrane protein